MTKPAALLKGFERYVDNPLKHEKTAAALKQGKRSIIFDEATTGLALVVSPKGKKTFSIVARDPAGKQVWKRIGDPALMTVTEARQEAVEAVLRVRAGQAPVKAPAAPVAAPETFRTVAERFIERWVDKGGKKQDGEPLRSKGEIERQLTKYIYPEWGDEPFLSIRRGKVMEMLDSIADNNGMVQADRVLSTLAKMFNWYRQYDENYVSPIIPEMRRAGGRSRTRILSDDEIRAVWDGCAKAGTFGALVKVALLTAQRRAKVRQMRWQDISDDGLWTIPAEAREKVNAGELKLPKMALDVINAQPKIEDNPFVFTGRGNLAFNSVSAGKALLDKHAPIEPWTIHDLRRTARSLMSRAGVRSDIAERTLGHVIAGVEGVYDRHAYTEEKGAALAALASLVERILANEEGNVVQMAAAR